jgi:hypothetical protein
MPCRLRTIAATRGAAYAWQAMLALDTVFLPGLGSLVPGDELERGSENLRWDGGLCET